MSSEVYLVGIGEVSLDHAPATGEPLSPQAEPLPLAQKIQSFVCQVFRFARILFFDYSGIGGLQIAQASILLPSAGLSHSKLTAARALLLRGIENNSKIPFHKSLNEMQCVLRVTEWLYNDPNNQHKSCGAIFRDFLKRTDPDSKIDQLQEKAEQIAQTYFDSITKEKVTLGSISEEEQLLIRSKLEQLHILVSELFETAKKEQYLISASLGFTELPDLSTRFCKTLNELTKPFFDKAESLH